MPTGTQFTAPQTLVPTTSTASEAIIPKRQLFESVAQPSTQVNAPAINKQSSDAGLQSLPAGVQNLAAAAGVGAPIAQGETLDAAVQAAASSQVAAAQSTAANAVVQDPTTGVASTGAKINELLSGAGTGCATLANLVWAWNCDEDLRYSAGSALGYLDDNANQVATSLKRLRYSCNFVTAGWSSVRYEDFPNPSWVNLNDAYPGAKISSSETDVEMLRRVYPDYAWLDDYFGLHLPGVEITVPSGDTFQYWYQPIPTADDFAQAFYKLWNFIDSAGRPQNGIQVFMQFLAMVPVQWNL